MRQLSPQLPVASTRAMGVISDVAGAVAEWAAAVKREQTRGELDRPTPFQIACWVVAALLFAVEKFRVVHVIGRQFTTEDQTIFWYVTYDYLHLNFPEPLFYGSPYSSHLESLLAAPLVALGMKVYVAVPWVTAVLTAAPFALLSFFAWQRRLYTSAILVLCSQFLLPVEFGALTTQAAQPTGGAVGGIAAALWLSGMQPRLKYFLVGLLGAVALCLHPNSIYLVGPTLAYVFFARYRSRTFWLWCVPPIVAVAIAYSRALRFYTEHPAYLLHDQWPLDFQWSAYSDGLDHLDRHLGDLTPSLFSASGFLIFFGLAALWFSVMTRSWARAFASAVLVIGVLGSLAITKAHNGGASFTFPFSRIFYSYPLGILFLGLLWAEVVPAMRGHGARVAGVIGALGLLALGLWRQAQLSAEMERVLAVPQSVVLVANTRQVRDDCLRLRAIAVEHAVDLVLHVSSRVEAYACGALWYGQLDTLFPAYDRRTDNVLRERDRVRSRILITEPPRRVCRTAQAHGLDCRMLEGEPATALISSPGVSALQVSEWLGIEVRHL